jgi:hypothetical protein
MYVHVFPKYKFHTTILLVIPIVNLWLKPSHLTDRFRHKKGIEFHKIEMNFKTIVRGLGPDKIAPTGNVKFIP